MRKLVLRQLKVKRKKGKSINVSDSLLSFLFHLNLLLKQFNFEYIIIFVVCAAWFTINIGLFISA